MSKIVYGVSKGEYSDWRIVAIFEDKDVASKYAAVNHHNDNIEDIPLNPDFDETLVDHRNSYYVKFDGIGNIIHSQLTSKFSNVKDNYSVFGNKDVITLLGIKASSEEEAIKVASEKRRMFIANNYKI